MPVKTYTGINRSALIVAFASIFGLLAMVYLGSRILSLASDGELQVASDSQKFQLENAEQWVEDIKNRGPVAFPDASGRDRDIYLQHVGDEVTSGWYVFGVRSVGAPIDCVAQWQPDTREFIDDCDGTIYPETGEGLPSYPITVTETGKITIDINASDRATADATTTTSVAEGE
ncbi:MAG: hypothetical protein R2706_20810 [Acidimicrobiales bacterium]